MRECFTTDSKHKRPFRSGSHEIDHPSRRVAASDARLVDMVAGSVMSTAVPGARAWDIIVGDRFIAAIAAPAPDAATTALASATADQTVTIEALVALIPLGGADAVESFGIVWWPGGSPAEVTAVVRGDAVVDLTSPGGTRRFDARGIRPWHLADFDAVIAIRMVVADAPLDHLGETRDVVPHARASLRASAVEWNSPAAPRRPLASAADADTILMGRARPAPIPDTADGGEPLAAADTILTPRRQAGSASAPAALPPAEPTRAPSPAQRPVPAFRIGDGAPHPIDGPVLIGRRPLAPRIPVAGPPPELVVVASPRGAVSATHLELQVEGTRVVATDLRSTNGTTVHARSGTRRMRPGESIVVAAGTRLDLGDDTIVEILPAPVVPPSSEPSRQQAAP
jgi:pSer/pThr/pTyr-binding forkhead associated (FHA) protein